MRVCGQRTLLLLFVTFRPDVMYAFVNKNQGQKPAIAWDASSRSAAAPFSATPSPLGKSRVPPTLLPQDLRGRTLFSPVLLMPNTHSALSSNAPS